MVFSTHIQRGNRSSGTLKSAAIHFYAQLRRINHIYHGAKRFICATIRSSSSILAVMAQHLPTKSELISPHQSPYYPGSDLWPNTRACSGPFSNLPPSWHRVNNRGGDPRTKLNKRSVAEIARVQSEEPQTKNNKKRMSLIASLRHRGLGDCEMLECHNFARLLAPELTPGVCLTYALIIT